MEPGPVLPTAEGWTSVTFTAPSTATYIKVGVLVYSPAVGDQFFLNRMELYEYNGGQGNMVFAQNGNFTYQYHLKDHLGNVRLTFTTKDEKDISKATMETANSNTEQGQFLYYDEAVKVNSTIFDHTDVGTTWYSTRLNGSTNERFGLAKSLSVMPGDTVRAEVYAKYLDPNSTNWTAALNSLITSIGSGTAPGGTFIDGGLPGSTGGVAIPYAAALDKASETGSAPKAFLNYIVFDRDFNLKDGGYVRITTACREYGQDAPHERLAKELVITEPGYVYLYISNDNVSLGGGEVEVYWDDFRVEHIKSLVVQSQDYYPFGLTFNSYNRENSLPNRLKLFQDQQHVDDLGLNWDGFKWRNHMPELGRFFGGDKLAEKYYYNSPYAFSENKVVSHRELEGLEAEWSTYSQSVSQIEARPRYDHENNGEAFQGMTVSFTLTQHETKMEYDQNNVAIARLDITSVSRHTVNLDVHNAPVPFPKTASSFERHNPTTVKEIPVKSALGVVVTIRTPVSMNTENPKSETTKTVTTTGPVKLNESNSKWIKGFANGSWPGALS